MSWRFVVFVVCCFAVGALLFERLSPLPGIRISRGKLRPVYAFDGLDRCSGSAERKNERKKERRKGRKKERKKKKKTTKKKKHGEKEVFQLQTPDRPPRGCYW